MKNTLKNLLMGITGSLILSPILFIASLAYKLQARMESHLFPNNHNIEFESNGVSFKKVEKSWTSVQHLNNYTAQDVSLQPIDKAYLVSLNIPIESRETARKVQSELIRKFKKDSYFKSLK